MTTDTYNGWTNRETWLVNLWLANESVTDAACREICLGASSVYAAADALRDFVADDYLGEAPETGLASDLITGALARVSWEEIAEHFREE